MAAVFALHRFGILGMWFQQCSAFAVASVVACREGLSSLQSICSHFMKSLTVMLETVLSEVTSMMAPSDGDDDGTDPQISETEASAEL